jgi:hypothetical protein
MSAVLGIGLVEAAFCTALFLELALQASKVVQLTLSADRGITSQWINTQSARRTVTLGDCPTLISLMLGLDIELQLLDKRSHRREVCRTAEYAKRVFMSCTHSRKEYAMKRVLCLVLAVVLVAAVLVPVATARAASWKWNIDKTPRTLPDGTPAVLKIPYSQGTTFHERGVTLIQSMLTSKTSGARALRTRILSSSSIPTKFARASKATTTFSPPPSATTGTSSTGIGGNRYDDQIRRHRDYGV